MDIFEGLTIGYLENSGKPVNVTNQTGKYICIPERDLASIHGYIQGVLFGKEQPSDTDSKLPEYLYCALSKVDEWFVKYERCGGE